MMLRIILFLSTSIQLIHCIQVIPISKQPSNFGSAPIWDAKTQSLFFVDFVTIGRQPNIYRFDYKTGKTFAAYVEGTLRVSLIVPLQGCDDEYIIGVEDGLRIARWDGVSPIATIIRPFSSGEGRLNYAFVDPNGHLFAGSLSDTLFCAAPSNYSMYKYSKNKGRQLIFNQVRTSTGYAIDQKRGIFYHVDACSPQIVAFDYDLKTGDLCNGRVVFDFRRTKMDPLPFLLNLDIDRDGNLYVGLYLSSAVAVINPCTSTLLRTIPLPSQGVTGAVFGGPKMDKLLVTAGNTLIEPYGKGFIPRPNDPSLYIIDGIGTRGIEGKRANI